MHEFEQLQEQQKDFLNLLDFIEDEEIEELGLEEAGSEGFYIQSPEQAEYFIKKYKEWIEEEAEIKAYAKEYLAKQKEKIEKWEQSKLNEFKFQKERYMGLLEDYARANIDEKAKTKNIKLVEGTLQFRKASDKYDYDDPAILEYLKEERESILVSMDELNEIAFEDEEHGKVISVQILNGYVREANEASHISVKEDINKTSLKKAAKAKDGRLYFDDEKVPGVTVTPQDDSFSIK